MNTISREVAEKANENLYKIQDALAEIQKQEEILNSLGFVYKIVFEKK